MDSVLAKTNHINLLFDFYGSLLTERQYTFIKLYYQDNYSLGEISEQFSISRQAVNEHIKRAELLLNDYEEKLGMLTDHEQRLKYLSELKQVLTGLTDDEYSKAKHLIEQLIHLG